MDKKVRMTNRAATNIRIYANVARRKYNQHFASPGSIWGDRINWQFE
jgi:hypothetical protein